ncbi:DUF2878 domain-containing protein [Shewanella submarina]|uniref:DUF2878 domain-containing protein n=1 Tax=Shewanella submarina TaxID=2016376 RepID=A0ABV7GEV4_9GAMM|nr:DUF2878 domain-containing protein [Shewanella submarina]MCL1037034.1 DUF2878 domain-containing protein [Shewanella submarina]
MPVKPPNRLFVVINALSFQAVWWTGVLFGNKAILLSLALLVVHFALTPNRLQDLRLMLMLGTLGVLIDSLLTWLGVFEFSSAPIWLALLWCHFCLTLNASLGFLKLSPLWVSALLGAIFGPVSYLAGARFDAVLLPMGDWLTAAVLGLIWLIVMPLGVVLAKGAIWPEVAPKLEER